ncbi:MAG: hypothetical protein ABEH65_04100 [Halobacteriales archaeon]
MMVIGGPMLLAETVPLGLLLLLTGGFLLGLPHLHSGGTETTESTPSPDADSESGGSAI